MCTTTSTTNSVENETQTQRSVKDLLMLETYQGMTDAEIQSLLDYQYARALRSAEISAKLEAINVEAAQKIESAMAQRDAAMDMLYSYRERLEHEVTPFVVTQVAPKTWQEDS